MAQGGERLKPVFTSFYTDAYRDHAEGLIASLEAFGLEHDVRHLPSGGNWLTNVNHKAVFLLSMMARHPDRPIVWLDADARVRQAPKLFDTLSCDFACHYRHGVELLSGTMYFAPTAAAVQLLQAWHFKCAKHPERWDQVSLQDTIADMGDALRVERLPATYTCVFDDPKMGPPVIEHLQASRQLRTA